MHLTLVFLAVIVILQGVVGAPTPTNLSTLVTRSADRSKAANDGRDGGDGGDDGGDDKGGGSDGDPLCRTDPSCA
ncbi:hypothetical protein PGT21_006012 [Puccinia graminis f. sp. tritici]|uniref:Uncharacterized protein n=1 Tax=Puccinia graminis f. sp. tritici TaxID=56615 RepID=A0A5B0QEE6_PUCGR|nr:hypothetical protein PGT21_006012 [Puccinia graminis f. sp. tritici]KAA1123862.1 hypothetical protein PGTUg99_027102 [Puccinia graminis f. sp. tritici]